MGERLGEAVLDLRADHAHLKRDLATARRTTDGSLRDLQARTDKAAKVAGVALLAIGAAAWKATQQAADLGESMNKSREIFGRFAKDMPGMAGSVADSLGMARATALDAAAGIGAMLVPMGLSQREAARMSTRMTVLAADLGSLHNADPTEMLDRLRAGLSGESEPLKQFGIVLTEARVQAEAFRLGIAEQGATLTESQKIQARYSLAIRDAGAANGDFARTSGGLANQQRILTADLADLGAELGGVLVPAMTAGVGVARGLIGVISGNRTEFTVLVGVVGGLAVAVIAVNGAMRIYAATTAAASTVSAIFVTRTAAQATATTAATGAQVGLNTAMRANVIGIVITALALLVAGLVLAYQRSATFREVAGKAFDAVAAAAEVAEAVVLGIVTAIGKLLGVGRDIKEFFESLTGGSKTTAKDVAKAQGEIQTATRKVAGTAKGAAADYVKAQQVMQTGVAGTSAVAEAFGDKVPTIADTVVRRWGAAADQLVTAMAGKKEDAKAGGKGLGASYISGVVAGVQENQTAVNAAFASSVRQGEAAGRAAAKAKSPSELTKELGRDLGEGTARGVLEKLPRLKLAMTSTVRDAIAAARQNVPALAAGLASALGQALDAQLARRLGQLDEAGPEGANLRAMEAAQRARQTAAEQARLQGGIAESAAALAAGEEGAQERLTEAHVALADWQAQRAIDAERARLTDLRSTLEQEAAARKATAEQGLTDLADAFARGEIKQAAFTKRLTAILREAAPDLELAGTVLGKAFVKGYAAQLKALQDQVRELAQGPQVQGGVADLAPGITSPFAIQHQGWAARQRELATRLNELRKASTAKGSPGDAKVTADEEKAIDRAAAALATWERREPKRLALGGILTEPTLAMLREGGVDEAVVALDGSPRSWGLLARAADLMPGAPPAPAGGRGPLVHVGTMSVRAPEDVELIAARLSRYLATQGVRS